LLTMSSLTQSGKYIFAPLAINLSKREDDSHASPDVFYLDADGCCLLDDVSLSAF
jgi:hypothetical protein